jgi:hypothetical protein
MALWSPAITPPPQLPGRKHYAGFNIFERADNPLSVCGYVSGIRSAFLFLFPRLQKKTNDDMFLINK